MLGTFMVSLIRTSVPVVIGAGLGWLAARGLEIPVEAKEQVTAAMVTLVTVLYYAAVRLLERHVHPAFGWLLGMPAQLQYRAVGTGTTAPKG